MKSRCILPRLRAAIIAVVVIWTFLPLLPLAVWSFSAGWFWPALLPPRLSTRAWDYLISPTTRAMPALLTSAAVALVVVGLALAIGVPAGIALGRYRFRGRALAEALIFAPVLVPPLTVAMGLQVLFIRLGLADTFLGVVLVHLIFALPYVVLILAGAAVGLDPIWERQARSLGASPWRAFWAVILPLLRPSLVVAALFAFLVSWGQYALTLLIGGGRIWTVPLLVFAFARSSDPALAAAAALLSVAPTLLFLLVIARSVKGRTGSATLV